MSVSSFHADGVSTLLYPKGSSLAIHRDSRQGWVMGVSIGSAANFFFQENKSADKGHIRLESGDIVVYNATRLLHGVDSIADGSGPKWWTAMTADDKSPAYGIERFVLQYRDSSHVAKQ
jgi:hypothetical protein